MGRSVLYRGYARTLSETIEGINTITPESLLSAAQALRHSSRLTLK